MGREDARPAELDARLAPPLEADETAAARRVAAQRNLSEARYAPSLGTDLASGAASAGAARPRRALPISLAVRTPALPSGSDGTPGERHPDHRGEDAAAGMDRGQGTRQVIEVGRIHDGPPGRSGDRSTEAACARDHRTRGKASQVIAPRISAFQTQIPRPTGHSAQRRSVPYKARAIGRSGARGG